MSMLTTLVQVHTKSIDYTNSKIVKKYTYLNETYFIQTLL